MFPGTGSEGELLPESCHVITGGDGSEHISRRKSSGHWDDSSHAPAQGAWGWVLPAWQGAVTLHRGPLPSGVTTRTSLAGRTSASRTVKENGEGDAYSISIFSLWINSTTKGGFLEYLQTPVGPPLLNNSLLTLVLPFLFISINSY